MPDGSSAFPIYRDLGVEALQLHLRWNMVAPSRPSYPKDPHDSAYRWPPAIDDALSESRRHGIEVMLMVIGSPAWANGGRGPAWAPKDRAYARFLRAASERYPAVRRWMIWGEPNGGGNFQPLPPHSPVGPRRYATLLRAAYRALKKADPRDRVIGGMTLSFGDVQPADFLRWMRLPNGKPPPLDLFGHNPFSTRFPDLRYDVFDGTPAARDIAEIDTYNKDIRRAYRGHYKRFRQRGPRLWLSEFSISSDRGSRTFNFYVSRREQARWLTAAYRIAHKNPWIAGLGWFELLDESKSVPYGRTNGLMTYAGKRKPAYYAYRRAP